MRDYSEKKMRGKLGAKGWFAGVALVILVTALTIFLNIPVARQILAFLWFALIPGALILYILRFNKSDVLKRLILSAGLSLFFFIFFGLLINSLGPLLGNPQPLSTYSLLAWFTPMLLLLCFAAYWRNKDSFRPSSLLPQGNDKGKKYLWPLIFPLLFPFISALGAFSMKNTLNNTTLMLLLALIALYIIMLVWLRNNVHEATFPVAIFMMSVALLIMHTLTSDFPTGADNLAEFITFRETLLSRHWSMLSRFTSLTACLSLSLLPTIFQSLLGISAVYVFKVIYMILFALVPLTCYVICSRYFEKPIYPFLASCFIVVQYPFINNIPDQCRLAIALIFFILVIMILLDDNMRAFDRSLFLLIFTASLLVSYYVTPLVLLTLLVFLWLIPRLLRNLPNLSGQVSLELIVLIFVLIFFWWSQITSSAFKAYVILPKKFVARFISDYSELLLTEARGGAVYTIYGQVVSLGNALRGILHYLGFGLITIGLLGSIIQWKKTKFALSYLILAGICWMVIIGTLIIPYVTIAYSARRLYIQLVLILAPMFVVGCNVLLRYIRQSWVQLSTMTLVVICLLLANSFWIDTITGTPRGGTLTKENIGYIYQSDVIAANWLTEHNGSQLTVHKDYEETYIFREFEFSPTGERPNFRIEGDFFVEENLDKLEEGGYLYLRYANVVNRKVFVGWPIGEGALHDYVHLFAGRNKIYDSSRAQIYLLGTQPK